MVHLTRCVFAQVYVPGSNTLQNVGFQATNTSDYGFADIKAAISTLAAGGVESFLSMCVCCSVQRAHVSLLRVPSCSKRGLFLVSPHTPYPGNAFPPGVAGTTAASPPCTCGTR